MEHLPKEGMWLQTMKESWLKNEWIAEKVYEQNEVSYHIG